MTGTARLRVTLVLAAIALVVGIPSEASRAGEADRSSFRSSVAFASTGFIAARAGEAVETRLQRDTKSEKGQRSVRQDGVSGPSSSGGQLRRSATALAAVLERAGHPERVGHILLRGPPDRST